MSVEPQKRIVLSRYWIGDTVYHVCDGSRGLILHVQFGTEYCVPQYYVVMPDREGEWCFEMEISSEPIFNTGSTVPVKK